MNEQQLKELVDGTKVELGSSFEKPWRLLVFISNFGYTSSSCFLYCDENSKLMESNFSEFNANYIRENFPTIEQFMKDGNKLNIYDWVLDIDGEIWQIKGDGNPQPRSESVIFAQCWLEETNKSVKLARAIGSNHRMRSDAEELLCKLGYKLASANTKGIDLVVCLNDDLVKKSLANQQKEGFKTQIISYDDLKCRAISNEKTKLNTPDNATIIGYDPAAPEGDQTATKIVEPMSPWELLDVSREEYDTGMRNAMAEIAKVCGRKFPADIGYEDLPELVAEKLNPPKNQNTNKYSREIKPGLFVDVYDVLDAFKTGSSAIDHAVKKLLAPGKRGHKDELQDLNEAMQSIQRRIDHITEWNENR